MYLLRIKMTHTPQSTFRIAFHESIWKYLCPLVLLWNVFYLSVEMRLKTLTWLRWVTRTTGTVSGVSCSPSLLCCLSDWYKLYTIQISSLTRVWNGWGPDDNEAITVMWPTNPPGHLWARTLLPCSRFDHTEKLVSVLLPFSGSLS